MEVGRCIKSVIRGQRHWCGVVAIGLPLIRRGGEKALIDPPRSGQNDCNQATFWPFWFRGRRKGDLSPSRLGDWLPHAKWSHYAPLCRDWSRL